eukprot:SAG11_NODE_823_length_6997_cov_60.301247_6_plen_107_part_00
MNARKVLEVHKTYRPSDDIVVRIAEGKFVRVQSDELIHVPVTPSSFDFKVGDKVTVSPDAKNLDKSRKTLQDKGTVMKINRYYLFGTTDTWYHRALGKKIPKNIVV